MADDRPAWKAGTGKRIERLYAWVVEEADGGEGVAAISTPALGWTPLVGADLERMESMRDFALAIRHQLGRPVVLKEFGCGTVIETLA